MRRVKRRHSSLEVLATCVSPHLFDCIHNSRVFGDDGGPFVCDAGGFAPVSDASGPGSELEGGVLLVDRVVLRDVEDADDADPDIQTGVTS